MQNKVSYLGVEIEKTLNWIHLRSLKDNNFFQEFSLESFFFLVLIRLPGKKSLIKLIFDIVTGPTDFIV